MIDKQFVSKISWCPLCGKLPESLNTSRNLLVKCNRCGHFYLEDAFLSIISGISEADRHLLGGYTRENWQFFNQYAEIEYDTYQTILACCPHTVNEKAIKFLMALRRMTEYFGEVLTINLEDQFPLAYAQNSNELFGYINYLCELIYIKNPMTSSAGYDIVITGKGFEAIESRLLSPSITVFISSTCYDLLDLRKELADFIDAKGFISKVSNDPFRIDIEPTENSIDTCLRNVETADVVVCIIDGRYGPVLPPQNVISATHAEIQHARKIKKPIYYFMRDKAFSEYDLLRNNPDGHCLWVERYDEEQRKKWVAFVKEVQNLSIAQNQGHSNWIDSFTDSVQLKKLVLKRLGEYQRGTIAK